MKPQTRRPDEQIGSYNGDSNLTLISYTMAGIFCIRELLEAQSCLSSHSHMHVHKCECTSLTMRSGGATSYANPNISPVSRPVYDEPVYISDVNTLAFCDIEAIWSTNFLRPYIPYSTARIPIVCQNVGNADRTVSLYLPLRDARTFRKK